MINALEKASGKKIPYEKCPRRVGDLGSVYADSSLAEKELGWKAERDLDDMCTSNCFHCLECFNCLFRRSRFMAMAIEQSKRVSVGCDQSSKFTFESGIYLFSLMNNYSILFFYTLLIHGISEDWISHLLDGFLFVFLHHSKPYEQNLGHVHLIISLYY